MLSTLQYNYALTYLYNVLLTLDKDDLYDIKAYINHILYGEYYQKTQKNVVFSIFILLKELTDGTLLDIKNYIYDIFDGKIDIKKIQIPLRLPEKERISSDDVSLETQESMDSEGSEYSEPSDDTCQEKSESWIEYDDKNQTNQETLQPKNQKNNDYDCRNGQCPLRKNIPISNPSYMNCQNGVCPMIPCPPEYSASVNSTIPCPVQQFVAPLDKVFPFLPVVPGPYSFPQPMWAPFWGPSSWMIPSDWNSNDS